jgi:hypothetical protein
MTQDKFAALMDLIEILTVQVKSLAQETRALRESVDRIVKVIEAQSETARLQAETTAKLINMLNHQMGLTA